jgi:hypothetical protein
MPLALNTHGAISKCPFELCHHCIDSQRETEEKARQPETKLGAIAHLHCTTFSAAYATAGMFIGTASLDLVQGVTVL